LVFVQTNKFWKFRWFLREVTIHLKHTKKNTMKWLQKRSFICMNNEKSLCILAWKQDLPIVNACIWDEERPSLIILSQGWNISFAVPFWA
jgi:acyl-CoA thioesterase